jgi:hypothetical protein
MLPNSRAGAHRENVSLESVVLDTADDRTVLDFLFLGEFSLLSLLLFPADSLLRFQAGSHLLQYLHGVKSNQPHSSLQIPVFFPVNGNFALKTGSQETASSARQSAKQFCRSV